MLQFFRREGNNKFLIITNGLMVVWLDFIWYMTSLLFSSETKFV